jgi:hypothetical protein
LRLEWIARGLFSAFDCVEIQSIFYDPPRVEVARKWRMPAPVRASRAPFAVSFDQDQPIPPSHSPRFRENQNQPSLVCCALQRISIDEPKTALSFSAPEAIAASSTKGYLSVTQKMTYNKCMDLGTIAFLVLWVSGFMTLAFANRDQKVHDAVAELPDVVRIKLDRSVSNIANIAVKNN